MKKSSLLLFAFLLLSNTFILQSHSAITVSYALKTLNPLIDYSGNGYSVITFSDYRNLRYLNSGNIFGEMSRAITGTETACSTESIEDSR